MVAARFRAVLDGLHRVQLRQLHYDACDPGAGRSDVARRRRRGWPRTGCALAALPVVWCGGRCTGGSCATPAPAIATHLARGVIARRGPGTRDDARPHAHHAADLHGDLRPAVTCQRRSRTVLPTSPGAPASAHRSERAARPKRCGAQTSGPAVAGALVWLLSAPWAVLVDAASYLASGVLLLRVPVVEPARRRAPLGTVRHEAVEGLRWVYTHTMLRPLALSTHSWFFFLALAGAVETPVRPANPRPQRARSRIGAGRWRDRWIGRQPGRHPPRGPVRDRPGRCCVFGPDRAGVGRDRAEPARTGRVVPLRSGAVAVRALDRRAERELAGLPPSSSQPTACRVGRMPP